MIGPLQQLEALRHDPRLSVQPDQRATIVGNIVHSVMHPYFLRKTPEEQEAFRSHYLHHMEMIADYCLRQYVEYPEPRLTIEVVKGLHRVLYHNSPTVPVTATDGSTIAMTPGEFKTTPVFVRRSTSPDDHYGTTAPAGVAREMALLLEQLHDNQASPFQRYLRFMLDLVLIHPFTDSNGKLALLFGDLFLLKQGIQPPYFTRYKWDNPKECYQFVDRYRLDSGRDISIFYPPTLRLYADLGFIAPTRG